MKFFKIKSSDTPTKPKPTDILPDNLMYVWDPNANDWIILQKDTNKATPPLYNPQNQNVVNTQTTSYMSTIKSASLEILDKEGKEAEEGMWLYKPMIHNTFRGDIPLRLFQVKVRHQKNGEEKPYLLSENKLITKGINHVKDGILFDTYEEAKQYSESHKTKEEKEFDKLNDWEKTDHYLSKYSSCLAEFLDGPRYSKEVKIEAGLIKEGLLKYAGFDFNRGTKYTITTAGLEILRKASEAEHNEALNEREKLAYLFGFNTNKDTTLDTTGKEIKSDVTDLSFEEAMQLDITDPRAVEYLAKNFSVSNITASAILEMCGNMQDAYQEMSDIADEKGYGWDTNEDSDLPTMDQILKGRLNKTFTITEADGCELGKVTASSELDAKVKFGIEHPEYADSLSIKAICAKYEETTEQHLDYPNPSETPHTDVVIENHDGWVNTADQKRPYTEEEKRLLPLFKLLNEYVARKEITLEETPDNQPGTVATGQAEVINDLEHKVKDLGFHCEPIAEITDNDYIGADIYSLKIFYK